MSQFFARRRWPLVLLCAVLAAFPFSSIRSEEKPDAAAPETVLRDFYQWYVALLLKNGDAFKGDRTDLKRYVSPRLIREIDSMTKGPDGLNGDYFLDAQDFDNDWGRNITIATPVLKGDRATALVKLKGAEMSKELSVSLTKDRGLWKIDKVAGK